MRPSVRIGLGVVLGVFGVSVAGCNGDGDQRPRERVSGTVTLDGAPLAAGDITFMPADPASSSTAAAGKVVNGAYDIPHAEGPMPGPYRVSISSVEETAPPNAAKAQPGDGDAPILKERLPATYNKDTTLKADVAKGGKNVFDFPLNSK